MSTARQRLVSSLIFFAVLASAPGIAAAQRARPDFTGIWSGNFTTQDNEFWLVEDFTACFAGCTPASRAYFGSLLDDPANDERPVLRALEPDDRLHASR